MLKRDNWGASEQALTRIYSPSCEIWGPGWNCSESFAGYFSGYWEVGSGIFLVVAFVVAMGLYFEQIHFSRFQIFLSSKVNLGPWFIYAVPGKVRGSSLQTHMWFLALTILYIPGHVVVHTSSLCNYLKRIWYCLLIKGLWDTHHTLWLGVIRQIPYIKLFTFPTLYQTVFT